MASSKNPVEVQVLVGPDESLGSFAGAAVQRLPRQAQEGLQPIPSEISISSSPGASKHSVQSLRYICFLNPVIMWGQEIEKQEGLLELLNPCFCAVSRADYVELQEGENMYHIHQY